MKPHITAIADQIARKEKRSLRHQRRLMWIQFLTSAVKVGLLALAATFLIVLFIAAGGGR